MSRVGAVLRALVNPGAQQFPVEQLILLSRGSLSDQVGQFVSPLCQSAASVRRLAAAAGDQQGAQSSQDSAPTVRPSLKDLLQASTQRIAGGEVSRVLEPATSQPETATLQDAALSATEALLSQGDQALGTATGAGPASTLPGAAQQQQRLLHPKYGYAALGGVMPSDAPAGGAAGLVGMLTSQSARVNPRKAFMPGDTYEPQDLNPFAARAVEPRRRTAPVQRPSVAEVLEKADYKNVAFLSRWFLSPAGRLLTRRQTRLPVTVHRHVSKQVKLARHMGLMAGEARLDKMHLPQLREQEVADARKRAEAAAGGAGAARPNELFDFGA